MRGLNAIAAWRRQARSSGLALAPLAVVTSLGVGCGKSQHDMTRLSAGGEAGHGGDGAQSIGGSIFSDIDLRLRVASAATLDLDARDPAGAPLAEPPIVVVVAATVEVNGATAAGRVPGLAIFADGVALDETGSAGSPQRFSFMHRVVGAAHGQAVELEFRYEGESFTLPVVPPLVELTSPANESTLAADEPLVLDWTGIEMAPDPVAVSPLGNCSITFRAVTPTSFEPMSDGTGSEPPCRFEVSAAWLVEAVEPAAPFQSLTIERGARRIHRFTIE